MVSTKAGLWRAAKVAAMSPVAAPTALVAVFLAVLHVQRLSQQLTLGQVGQVHALLQEAIVGQQIVRRHVAEIVGGAERQRRHARENPLSGVGQPEETL